MAKRLLFLIALLVLASTSSATIYRWVGANGTVTFRDIPPPDGVDAQVVTVSPSFIGSGSGTAAAAPGERKASGSPAAAAPSGNNRVEIFVTSWCPYCTKAKAFLQQHNIPYQAYDVERDQAAAKRKVQLAGQSGVPFALINGTPVIGFDEGRYRQLLGITSP